MLQLQCKNREELRLAYREALRIYLRRVQSEKQTDVTFSKIDRTHHFRILRDDVSKFFESLYGAEEGGVAKTLHYALSKLLGIIPFNTDKVLFFYGKSVVFLWKK